MAAQIIRALDQAAVAATTHMNGHWASAVYTLSQTALVHKETTDPKFSQHALKIQSIFNLMDIGSVLWGIKTLAQIKTTPWTRLQIGAGLAAVTLFYFASLKAVDQIQKFFNPHKEPKKLLEDLSDDAFKKISIGFNLPFSQLLAQQLYLARMILNVALVCLSNYRALSAISLGAQIYSSIQLYQLKWLALTRFFPVGPDSRYVKQIDVTYRCLLTPATHKKPEDICAICQHDEPDSYFCSYHPFHDSCMALQIYTKSSAFGDVDRVNKTTLYDKNSKSYSYDIEIQEQNLPRCPYKCLECYPFHGFFDAVVHDKILKKHFPARVHVTGHTFIPVAILPRFMEGLNLVYNAFQATLATFQKLHPELAGQILFAQRVMLLTDSIALARDSLQLYWQQENDTKPQEQKIKAAALSILGALGILLISIKMKPSFDLKKSLALSPEQLKCVNVFWAAPRIHRLSQLIFTARIALNIFSAFLTEKQQRGLHIVAAFLQSLTLYKISQLPWLKFERTFKNPEGSIWAQKSGNQHSLNELTIGSHILLQEPVSSTTVSPTIQSIYNYFTSYFNGSKNWYSYWIVTKRGNKEVSRTFNYNVTVTPPAFVGPFLPYINRITASAIHRRHGTAVVNLK